ncbi:MAG: sulfatase [Thermoanaerobaculia bacterium]
MKVSRPSFERKLTTAVLVLSLTVLPVAGARAAAGDDRKDVDVASAPGPNIILVLTDDQDVELDSLSYMPRVKQLLSDQGTSFSNFFVPLSLCCPSRTSILRGQYPHNTHVLTNSLPLGGFEKVYADNLESSTIATVLHGAGYRTVLLGKYLNGYPDTASPTYVPPGWDEWYSPASGNPYSEFHYTLNENGALVKYGRTPGDYLTDVIAGKAEDFIHRMAAKPGQPFFIYFATYAPHAPYTPAPRHAHLFPNVKAPRPPSFNEADVTDKPAYIATKPLLTQAKIDGIDVAYRKRLQALQSVDEAVAALVEALAATGRLSNSYIFFTSDNGYHMGEHRLPPGKYTPYETDIHVPLIVRGPRVPAAVVRDQLAANVDLAETFAELAGVPQLSFSDGRSLTGLLRPEPPSSWRQAFLLEEFATGEFVLTNAAESADPWSAVGVREPPDAGDLQGAAARIPSYYGFQAPGYKYVEYETGERELYLASDPYELTNVALRVSPSMAAALAAYLGTLHNCKGDGCRAAESVAPPPLVILLSDAKETVTVETPASSTVAGGEAP